MCVYHVAFRYFALLNFHFFNLLYIIRKTLKGRKQTNKYGKGQSGNLRQTRASSGPRVRVAKTYRDENETKMNISTQTQRPSLFLVFYC